jgi:hypothetical protein
MAMGVSIGGKQISEFVVDDRFRNGFDWQQRRSQRQRRSSDEYYRERTPSS